MMEEIVLQALKLMYFERLSDRKHPTSIMYRDFIDRINISLNKLYIEKKIKVGQTINDKYIEVMNEGYGG